MMDAAPPQEAKRFFVIRQISDATEVHRTEVRYDPESTMYQRALSGLLHRIDGEKFYVDEVEEGP